MKRKELNKTFMLVLNYKNPLVSMVYTKLFQRCKCHLLFHRKHTTENSCEDMVQPALCGHI